MLHHKRKQQTQKKQQRNTDKDKTAGIFHREPESFILKNRPVILKADEPPAHCFKEGSSYRIQKRQQNKYKDAKKAGKQKYPGCSGLPPYQL